MPSKSIKQQRFFNLVKNAKHNPNAPENLKKVANSMSDSDIDDFANHIVELKTKKAILSIIKDIYQPISNINEMDFGDNKTDIITKTFHVKEEWSKYIKRFIGQPLSPKELNALGNFKEKQPSTIGRTEIWYNTTDTFGTSKTTNIKKMKDSGQFSFTAFQKNERPTPEGETGNEEMVSEENDLEDSPEISQDQSSTGTENPPEDVNNKTEKLEKDDIIVTKSVLFKDDIKGAAILVEFLKKLNL